MTSLGDFRAALTAVPTRLLSAEDRRVHADALVALDALERIDVVPTSVAFVGSSGSGKSTLVNAALGMALAPVGVARPTTTVTAMYGGSGPVSLAAASEYVHVPSMRQGLLVIDTPPFEHDPEAVSSVMSVADLVVVVVTPSRYADASVAAMIETLPARRPSAVVMNRIAVGDDERDLLVTSAETVLAAPVIELDEGGDVGSAIDALIETLAIDATDYARAAVLRSGAAAAGAHTARAVAAAAPMLAGIDEMLTTITIPRSGSEVHTVFDEWPATRADMVLGTQRAIRAIDDAIVDVIDPTIGRSIASSLPPFEPGTLAVALDAWRARAGESCIAAATIRWRQRSARELLLHQGWRCAVNPDIVAPKRYGRLLGSRRTEVEQQSQGELFSVLDGPRTARVEAWKQVVAELSSYAPGVLLSAAEGFAATGGHRA